MSGAPGMGTKCASAAGSDLPRRERESRAVDRRVTVSVRSVRGAGYRSELGRRDGHDVSQTQGGLQAGQRVSEVKVDPALRTTLAGT